MISTVHFSYPKFRSEPTAFNAIQRQTQCVDWHVPAFPCDVLQDSRMSLSQPENGLKFGAANFKKLLKEFKKLNGSNLTANDRQKSADAFALHLFTQCKTEKELLDFAKQAGIVVHCVEEGTPLAQRMAENGAQGLAAYPLSRIEGLTPQAIQYLRNPTNEPGFEIIEQCEREKKPLVLIKPSPEDEEFHLYVLRHELFHIIQQTLGDYGWSAANYENERLASNVHLDLLKNLRMSSSIEAQKIRNRAEHYKAGPPPSDAKNTFGTALRQVSRLDLQTYEFFCKNAERLKLSPRIKQHNENLKAIYETIKFYSYSPDYNAGLKSVPMIRS